MSRKKHKKKSSFIEMFRSIRFVFLFMLFSILLFSYPGNGLYTNLFAYEKSLFVQEAKINPIIVPSFPYVVYKGWSPQVSAVSVYIIEKKTGTPVYEKDIHKKLHPASTAKIITALVASEHFKPESILEVKRSYEVGQTMELIKGEKMTFENMLYGLLVHSGNDAAYTIADNWPGGQSSFVAAMNKKAQELHMTDSRFANPAGLDEEGQYTTSYDLSLAARVLLKSNELSKIVSIKNITIADINFRHFHELTNINKLLGEIPGVGGLKTGYTENAKENLVTLYRFKNHDFLIVLLKSEDRFEDTKAIVSWIGQAIDFTSHIDL